MDLGTYRDAKRHPYNVSYDDIDVTITWIIEAEADWECWGSGALLTAGPCGPTRMEAGRRITLREECDG
jgi:hypothetical protein